MKIKIINPAESSIKKNIAIAIMIPVAVLYIALPYYCAKYFLGEEQYTNFPAFLKGLLVEMLEPFGLGNLNVFIVAAVIFVLLFVYIGYYAFVLIQMRKESSVDSVRELEFDDNSVSFVRNFGGIENREKFSYGEIADLKLILKTKIIETKRDEHQALDSVSLTFLLKNKNIIKIEHAGIIGNVYQIFDFKDKFEKFGWGISGPQEKYLEFLKFYEKTGYKILLTEEESEKYLLVSVGLVAMGICDLVINIIAISNPIAALVSLPIMLPLLGGSLYFLVMYLKDRTIKSRSGYNQIVEGAADET